MARQNNFSADYQEAENLSRDRRLHLAFLEAVQNEDSWLRATRDPESFLHSHGVDLPGSLIVRFLDGPSVGKPVPDFQDFLIRQSNCRTIWVKKLDEVGYEQVTICLGFEIIRRESPRGPIERARAPRGPRK